ncbi:MAG: hypothetical protein HAW59_04840 [Betaproteobacteria bacterium]|nr:hypothetical protein [Betaproteobacteria bacterium]
MTKTKLILAVFFATALFSQSAWAFGAIWEYGGNWGRGKGVGAVANYETQKEADRAAIAQCKKERPHYATKSKWGKCRVVEQFAARCAGAARYVIQGAFTNEEQWGHRYEAHSSVVFYAVNDIDLSAYGPDESGIRELDHLETVLGEWGVSNKCYAFHDKMLKSNGDYANHVNPKYKDKKDFSGFDVRCWEPTKLVGVCDLLSIPAYKGFK